MNRAVPGPGPKAGTLRAARQVFGRDAERLLVPALVLSTGGVVAHVLVQYLLGITLAGSSTCARPYLDQVLEARCGPTNERAQLTLVVGLAALYLVGQLVVIGLYRSTLDVLDGEPIRSPLRGWCSGAAVATAFISAALLTLNTLFLVLPAIVLGFLIRYAPLYVLDAGLGPVPALVESTRFVLADLGSEVWFALRAATLLLAALLLLGLGLYVAVPIVLLAQTQRYRAKNPGRGERPEQVSAARAC